MFPAPLTPNLHLPTLEGRGLEAVCQALQKVPAKPGAFSIKVASPANHCPSQCLGSSWEIHILYIQSGIAVEVLLLAVGLDVQKNSQLDKTRQSQVYR